MDTAVFLTLAQKVDIPILKFVIKALIGCVVFQPGNGMWTLILQSGYGSSKLQKNKNKKQTKKNYIIV